jgi:hypothetical protein
MREYMMGMERPWLPTARGCRARRDMVDFPSEICRAAAPSGAYRPARRYGISGSSADYFRLNGGRGGGGGGCGSDGSGSGIVAVGGVAAGVCCDCDCDCDDCGCACACGFCITGGGGRG